MADDASADYGRDLRGYLIGFAFALVLTVVPFATVATRALSAQAALAVIAVCAVAQVIVHLRYFLHLDLSASKREDLLLVLFALLLICMMVGGSLWILYDLHVRMMP